MKFEKPIVEIQKFDLKDIISASGEPGSETEAPVSTPNPQTGTVAATIGQECVGTKVDDFNYDNCL